MAQSTSQTIPENTREAVGLHCVQLVPQLPPALDGVGDFVQRLAQEWPDQTDAPWKYMVCAGAQATRELWPDTETAEVVAAPEGLADGLEHGKCTTAVLHYSAYGFDRRGCPSWLPRGLAIWKGRQPDRRVAVMFHELYPNASPWQKAFWFRPLSKRVIAALVRMADRWITSCPEYEMKLVREFGASPAQGCVIPIGSSFIPAEREIFRPPWPLSGGRKLRIVIFGMPLTRMWTLLSHRHLLKRLCDEGMVGQIDLLGKSGIPARHQETFARLKQEIAPDPLWREIPDLPPAEVCRALASYDLGFISNWNDLLTKSTVFAALAAHHVPSVIAVRRHGRDTGYQFPDAFFVNDDQPAGVERCLEELRAPEIVEAKCRALRQFQEERLDWAQIAERWRAALAGKG